jgi:gamma-glutamyl hydrolase
MCKLVVLVVAVFAGLTEGLSIVNSNRELAAYPIVNDEPIIGVLSQEISYYLEGKYPGQFSSYIAASYVKFVEGGGARVVPIW